MDALNLNVTVMKQIGTLSLITAFMLQNIACKHILVVLNIFNHSKMG